MSATSGNVKFSNDLPAYIQMTLALNKDNQPFLGYCMQKNGVAIANSSTFEMGQISDSGAGSQGSLSENQVISGVSASFFGRSIAENNIQLFQEKVNVSYLREANQSGLTGLTGQGDSIDPMTFQISKKLEKIQKDWDYSALMGARNKPADSDGAWKMGGIIPAILGLQAVDPTAANYTDLNTAALTTAAIDELIADMFKNGVPMSAPAFVVNARTRIKLTALYKAQNSWIRGAADGVSGIATDSIATDFAMLDIITDVNVPEGKILICNTGLVRPVYLPIKGQDMYIEDTGKAGAADGKMINAHLSVDYASAVAHGLIENFA